MAKCELCLPTVYPIVWENSKFRIIEIDDPSYSAYYRVEHIQHIKEMTDLDESDRDALMKAVFIVESAIKIFYNPDKINLASLGNLTPHVHWHVIPRFYDDDHFPDSIWSQQKKFKKTEISDQTRKKINAFILKNLN